MSLNLKKDLANVRRKAADLSNVMYGKVPPHAREIEEAVLGAILLEKDKLSDVQEVISKPECFYVDAHQRIYAAILRLPEKGQAVDLLTITEELRRTEELELIGGAYFLTKLTMSVVSSAHVVPHARIVMEKYIQRELIRICGEILSYSYEDKTDVFELLDKAESEMFDISNNFLRKNYSNIGDILIETMEEIAKAKEQKKDVTGVTSGFADLDKITAGWQKTDLIILAARPSVGKTAFALNLALNAAMDKTDPKGVAVFSLEMGNTQIVKRMLSAVTEVSMEKISRGHLDDNEFTQISQRMNSLAKAPIFIDDQAGLNIFELRAKCRRLKAKNDIGLVIIDYLQLMHAPTDHKGGNREQEISKISRELKGLAKELSIPIIALSQLSRALESRGGEKGKVPQLSDLRESGAIEQDADMVMFIYRPEYHKIENDAMGQPFDGETHINIAKHRNGKLDTVKLKARLDIQKFVSAPSDSYLNDFDNPQLGMPGSAGDFGNSALYVQDNFKTLGSKANDMNFDEDEDFGFRKGQKGFKPPEDGDAPF